MLFEMNYFPRDNSHDQSSKLFKQNQQLDFYVQNSNFISIRFYIENIYWGMIYALCIKYRSILQCYVELINKICLN